MRIKDIKAVQDLAYCVGQWGCYLLCLCIVAEEITGKEIDVLKTAKYLIDNKIVDYDYQRPKAFKNSMYVPWMFGLLHRQSAPSSRRL